MTPPYSVRLLAFAVVASLFSFAPLVRGDSDPAASEVLQAHDMLMQAHDEDNVDQKKSDLEQAKQDIFRAGPRPLGGKRQKAVENINLALFELKQGDPHDRVDLYIEKANRILNY
jgi:hypothetical protein